MQLYAVNFIPLLSSLYMFRAAHTPIIRSTKFSCIYIHWSKQRNKIHCIQLHLLVISNSLYTYSFYLRLSNRLTSYTIQTPGYVSDDDFDYRDDKLRQHKHVQLRLQSKPASYVVRSVSAGAERLWEDIKKTHLSFNACVEELYLNSLFVCKQLLFSNTGGFKCLIWFQQLILCLKIAE